ncbi:Glucose-fructose oxidoreductase domain-containing protein 1 [Dermatophagoides farinae]|uniref:Glucose-fructose oxidoreductase domain-containing protein 1 n=1 Tax=Dermatophagoides farinae TaxID=6954 RepID=A0A922L6D2_DERFA|nr:Glucose-fructose oxidoreductase domain-containing protein 1 [Dermatophagoides farinae]
MLPGVGFFGTGTLAHLLIDQLQEQGFRIEGIWSPNLDDAQQLSRMRSIPFYSTIIDKVLLLPSVQLIVTACPPHYHNQIASKACGIGKHVICDWPPSHSLKDTIRMRKAASNYPALITLFLTGLRFVPTFNIMRRLIIDDNYLGHIRLINATVMCDVISVYKEKSIIWDKHMGGGLLSLYGTNIIDIISFLTDYRAHRVHGMIHCFKQLSQNAIRFNTTEDFVNFQMELHPLIDGNNNNNKNDHHNDNGSMKTKIINYKQTKLLTAIKDDPIIANIQLNGHHLNCQPKHEIYVYGTNGYLVCRDGDLYAFRTNNNNDNDDSNGIMTTTTTNALQQPLLNDNNNNVFGHETLLYKLQDMPSTTMKHYFSYETYNVYPKIYLIGIRLMIQALKNAFHGTTTTTTTINNHHLISSSTSTSMMNDNNSIVISNGGLNHDNNNQQEERSENELIQWIKDPVNQAVSFDDGIYLQTVLESIRSSSDLREWIRIHLFD